MRGRERRFSVSLLSDNKFVVHEATSQHDKNRIIQLCPEKRFVNLTVHADHQNEIELLFQLQFSNYIGHIFFDPV